MRSLQLTAATGAVIAAAWLLMFPVSDTTTYVRSIVYTQPTPEPRSTIIFVGDIMFDRSIRTAMEQYGGDYIFSCIGELLESVDFVVANLEGPITAHPSKSIGSKVGRENNFTFTFPTTTAELLFRHNIRLVSIGNNHILNFGREGEQATIMHLTNAGVGYFGDTVERKVAHVNVHGVKLAFVNFNEFAPPEHTNIPKYMSTSSTTIAQIKESRDTGEIPIVYAHWGGEYMPPLERVKTLARQFVDAGAAIIVGSHPHIVQEKELYLPPGRQATVPIYYSLGNFIFDQYWDESVRRGLLLRVEFMGEGVASVEEIPIDNQTDRRTCAV